LENEILLRIAMIELGIAPYGKRDSDIDKALASLTPDDRRLAKRKFRKLWKKAEKRYSGPQNPNFLSMKPGQTELTKAQKGARKNIVLHMLREDLLSESVDKK
jgi:hypothetical protein